MVEHDKSVLDNYRCEAEKPTESKSVEDHDHHDAREAGVQNHNEFIRVLVLFTEEAQNTGINMATQANGCVNQLNSTLLNSGIAASEMRFTLAGTQLLAGFTETGDIGRDLDTLQEDEVASNLRAQAQADIVILFTDDSYGTILEAAPGVIDADLTFGIVSVETALPNFTLAHEVGHLSGSFHQTCGINLTGTCSFATTDNHGHGFSKGILWWKEEYRTVMHEPLAGWDLIAHFSNPSVEYKNKDTGESGTSNNARVFRQNAHAMANYVSFTPPLGVYISGDDYITTSEYGAKTYTAIASNGSPPYQYQWCISNDGVSYSCDAFSSSNTKVHYFYPGSQYKYLRVTARDAVNATSNGFKTVYIEQGSGGGYPIATPVTLEENTLSLYPNPINQSQQLSLDLTSLSQGIYLVKIIAGEETYIRRILRETK